ncbi:DNA ligase [Streptomyces sp. enrichment culture]|uniref:ATP-dependent DNA ligase n=1 Tax=Streptomyces sp. enrichment culture TaxID=1795815 RepID=UPI003F55FE04
MEKGPAAVETAGTSPDRDEVESAASLLDELLPPGDDEAEAEMRRLPATRYSTVRPFLSLLGESAALIAVAASELSEALVLDGELVVPHEGRLHFVELQRRARRRGRGAIEAAAERPAYLIVFDVLEQGDTELLARPYRERRTILEDLFARDVLAAPFTLCPATNDRATALDWLDPAWGTAGIEGVVIKGGEQPYLPGKRAWIKVRSRTTAEALIGGVTGTLASPATLLPARYDAVGNLRLIARTTPLPTAERRDIARHLHPADPDHPWHGRRFSAGWGPAANFSTTPCDPTSWRNSRPTQQSMRACTGTPSVSCGCVTTSPCSRSRRSARDRAR